MNERLGPHPGRRTKGPTVESRSAVPPDLDLAVDRARQYLLSQQQDPGYWCGELQGDTILESEFVLLLAWLNELDRPVVAKAAHYLLGQQLAQGGWSLYPGGELDINVSVKAYFALKLAGHQPQSEPMRLRAKPLSLMGVPTASTALRVSTWRCSVRYRLIAVRR